MNSLSITVKQHLATACEHAWGAYVWFLQFIVYALLAYAVSKAVAAYLHTLPAAQPSSSAFIHARLSGRGVTKPVFCASVFPLFHPHAHPIAFGGPPTPGMMRRFLDRVWPLLIEAAALALSVVTGLVRLMRRAHEIYTGAVSAVVTPLSTRLNRGIVQLSALPNVPIRRATLRYLRPLLLLAGVSIGFFVFAGPSLKWAMAPGFCSLVLALGSARRAGHQGVPAPGMANAGLIGALEARAGARSAA